MSGNRAGRDAARAFATGCFQTHQTHDIRGLSERELQVRTIWQLGNLPCATHTTRSQSLEHWKKFFAESPKYKKVGNVLHEPIDPRSPVPEPCDPKRAKEQLKQSDESQKHHDEL